MSRRRAAFAAGLLFLATVVASPVRAAAPTNDQAAGATSVGDLPASIVVDLSEATVDGDPLFCGVGTASVWYRYTPAADAFLTIALASAPAGGTIHVAVDDPNGYLACVYAGSPQTLLAESGRTYFFQVATDGTATSMDLASTPTIANDHIDQASDIASLPATVAADLTASTSNGDSSACGATGNGAWYRLSPSDDVTVDIQADSGQSAFVTVVGTTIGDQIGCHYSWLGTLRLALEGGSTYHLQLSAYSPTAAGTSMTIDPLPPAPSNDAPSGAIVIGSLPFSASADLRSAHPDAETGGYCFDSDWPTVWYRYTPTAASILKLDVGGEARAAFFFDGPEDGFAGCTNGFEAGTILATAGTTYDIALGAPTWASGPAGLSITSSPAPTLDIVVNANGGLEKVGGVAVVSGTARCSSAGRAYVSVQLRQTAGRKTLVTGEGETFVECTTGAVAWTVRVPSFGTPFGSGAVAVEFSGETGEWPIIATDRGSATVKLKGK